MEPRKQQIEEVAIKIKEIENFYRVKIISENGFTGALIVDCIGDTDYQYDTRTGTIEEYE